MSTIVLNTLSYVGTGILNGVSYFWERTGGIVSSFSSLTSRVNFSQNRTNILWKLDIPVVSDEASTCACPGDVLRSTIVDVNTRFDRTATVAERLDAYERLVDLVASPEFKASITNLQLPV